MLFGRKKKEDKGILLNAVEGFNIRLVKAKVGSELANVVTIEYADSDGDYMGTYIYPLDTDYAKIEQEMQEVIYDNLSSIYDNLWD